MPSRKADGGNLNKFDKNNGFIFNIQKFSIHDGQGIRTLLFMKGCPLRCKWCCNPESQLFTEDLLFVKTKCIGCGYCVKACPEQAISAKDFTIDRSKCTVCGECVKVCYANSKKKVGRWITKNEVLNELEKDRIVFYNSNGGLTIGGGEPLCQPEFVEELLREASQLSFTTAMESCGHADWDEIKNIYPYLDELFMDLKCMDSARHKELTGVSNEIILENAKKIASLGTNITFRIPLIPGINDSKENIVETAHFVSKLGNNVKLEILPYHRLGEDKFKWMNRNYELEGVQVPEKITKIEMEDLIESKGCRVVR